MTGELVEGHAGTASSGASRAADGAGPGQGVARGEGGSLQMQGTPSAKSLTQHPVTPRLIDQHLAVIRKVDERIRRNAQKVVDKAMLAARLDDDGLPVDGSEVDAKGKPKGWSGVAYNVARDARKPLKQQPGYLAMAGRILDTYKKAEANEKPAPELNAGVVYIQQNVYNYPTRDVTGKD